MIQEFLQSLPERFHPTFWREADRETYALYIGLVALGALFILGVFIRVRLRIRRPGAPPIPPDEDHSHPMS